MRISTKLYLILQIAILNFAAASEIKIKKIKEYQLETSENCLIGHVIEAEIHNENMIIYSVIGENKLFAFDKNGKFLRKISRFGEGPGEFRSIDGVFSLKDKMAFYDIAKRKVVFFDKNYLVNSPSYIETKLNLSVFDLKVNSDKIITLRNVQSYDEKDLVLFNYKGEKIGEYQLQNIKNYDNYRYLSGGELTFGCDDNFLYYVTPLDWSLIIFDLKEKKIINRVDLTKYGLKIPNIDEVKKIESLKKRANSYENIFTINVLKNFLIVQTSKNILILKKNGELIKKFKSEDVLGEQKTFNIFSREKDQMFTISQPYELNGKVLNPKVIVFQISKD